MPLPAAAHVIAWTVLGTGLGVVLVRQNGVLDRLGKTDAERSAPATDVSPGGDTLGGAKDVLGLSTQVGELRRRLAVAESENKTLRSDHDKLVATVLASDGPAGAVLEAGSSKFVEKPGFEDAVRAVVDRYALEAKFRETMKKATGPLVPKKPKFEQLAKALSLSDPQSVRFGDDIRAIQQELFNLLQVPRPDGVVPFDEIAMAEQYPEGSPKKAEAFLKLFKLKIPDTEETYFEHAITLVQRVKEATKSYLDDSQRGVLDGIDLDWFGIEMPPQ
jgi:hypothetical protein